MEMRIRARNVRRALRDWVLGAGLFVVLAAGLAGNPRTWDFTSAAAADRVLTQTLDVTSPPGLQAETALVAALLQPPTSLGASTKGATLLLLGLTFSFMFTFNLAILRHLSRVYASPRRGAWGRSR